MSGRPSRRVFLAGAGAVGLAGLVAACSGEPPAPPAAPPGPPAPPAPTTSAPVTWTGDAQAVALCAAVSSLAASVYGEAAADAGAGQYGTTPAAVTTFLTTAGEQHTTHVVDWNEVLAAAGAAEVDGAPLTIAAGVRQRLAAARAPVDLALLALDLEGVLSATVASVLGEITYPAAVQTAAGVGPVAAMRASTALFLAGGLPPRAGDPRADPLAGALGRDALRTG